MIGLLKRNFINGIRRNETTPFVEQINYYDEYMIKLDSSQK